MIVKKMENNIYTYTEITCFVKREGKIKHIYVCLLLHKEINTERMNQKPIILVTLVEMEAYKVERIYITGTEKDTSMNIFFFFFFHTILKLCYSFTYPKNNRLKNQKE